METEGHYSITFSCIRAHRPPPDSALTQAITEALTLHGVKKAQLEIALVDDSQIATLNASHFGTHQTTDVLAFDLGDSNRALRGKRPARSNAIDAQIVLSVDTARREAENRGHSLDAELALYAVHGVLHLLGYDDDCKSNADRMHEMEDTILCSVGLGPIYERT